MKKGQSLKKILSVVLAVVMVFGYTTVAFAAEPVIEVSVAGTYKHPAFFNGTNTLYCKDAALEAPVNGMNYTVSDEVFNVSACDKLFIAEFLLEDVTEEHVQVIQQLFWGILNNYNGSLAVKHISDTATEAYSEIKSLMDNINADDFTVSYVVYETEEAEYQQLVDAIVHQHVAGDVVVENTTAANCIADGSYDSVVYCESCGVELERVPATVAATGHTAAAPVVENEVPATCTADGSYDTVIYCSVCNEELSRETTVVPATGHNYNEVATFAATSTCTKEGVKTYICSVCNDTYTDVIDALGHTEKVIPAVAPTCTTAGSTAGSRCSVCDVIITTPTTVDALGHTPANAVEENYVAPTCTTAGSKDVVVYCSVCNVELTRETITVPALGHTDGAVVVENAKEATCTVDGSYDNVTYCTVCDAETSRDTVTVPATGHVSKVVAGYPATCTETGLTDGAKCSVCDDVLTAQEEIPATGHSFGEWTVVKEATVEEQGLEERICSACGLVESRPIDKLEKVQTPEEPTTQTPTPEINIVVPDYKVPNIDVPDININIDINTGENEEVTEEVTEEITEEITEEVVEEIVEDTTEEITEEVVEEVVEDTTEEIVEELPTLDDENDEEEETPAGDALAENIVFTDVEIPNTDAGVGFGAGKLIAAIFFTGTGVVAVKNKKKKLNGLVDDDEEVDDE